MSAVSGYLFVLGTFIVFPQNAEIALSDKKEVHRATKVHVGMERERNEPEHCVAGTEQSLHDSFLKNIDYVVGDVATSTEFINLFKQNIYKPMN